MTRTNAAPEISEVHPDDWRLGGGGLLRGAARAVGIIPGRGGIIRIGIALALLTWVPLAVLTAVEGTLVNGPTIPFRYSFDVHTRFLLAIPLFFLAEFLFTRRTVDVLYETIATELVAADEVDRYQRALRVALRLWNSWAVEAVLVVVTLIAPFVGLRLASISDVSTWRTIATGRSSLAGWWYSVVSLSIFQFLLLRWTWRLLVWGWLLWQISGLRLRLIPTHPDRAGGLGPLGVAHVELSPLVFACSALAASTFAGEIKFAGATLAQFAVPAATIVVGTTVAAFAPLVFFSSHLLEVKQRGLLEYGALAASYAQAFDAKWLRGGAPPGESILGTADLQSLADLGNSFGVIEEMRIMPLSWSQIVVLTVSAAAPMLPLLLFAYPLDELIIGSVRSVFGA